MEQEQEINKLVIETVKKLNSEKGKVKVSDVAVYLEDKYGLEKTEIVNRIIKMEKSGVIKLSDLPINLEKYPTEITQLNNKVKKLIQIIKQKRKITET